jgi:hypothetical protein
LYFRFLRLASFLFFIPPNMIRILLAALLFFGHLIHAQNALDFDGLNDYVSMTSQVQQEPQIAPLNAGSKLLHRNKHSKFWWIGGVLLH